MAKLTVTEALQEHKTINNRLEKKREAILRYLARPASKVDPLQKEKTSSEQFVAQERQAIKDLEGRLVTIRTAILRSNLDTKLTVQGMERSIEEWLVWRRDVVENVKSFQSRMVYNIAALKTALDKTAGTANPDNVVVSLNEKELAGEIEHLETVLGELDGQLSLKNATVTIEV